MCVNPVEKIIYIVIRLRCVGKIAKKLRLVCPSARMEPLISNWTDFHENWYWVFFFKSVNKFQVSLKYNKNNGYFTWRPTYISDNISLNPHPANLDNMASSYQC